MAADGLEGLEMVKKVKPTLILLDIMMPKMSGLEVLKKLKSDNETASITVLMLTNFGEEKIVKEAIAKGAKGVLIKSDYPPDKLVNKIDEYLKNKT